MASPQTAATPPDAGSPASGTSDVMERFSWLPCEVTVEIPLQSFTVGDLLRLQAGSVVATASPINGDVALRVNKLMLSWARFEVLDGRLAVRITELA